MDRERPNGEEKGPNSFISDEEIDLFNQMVWKQSRIEIFYKTVNNNGILVLFEWKL